VGKPSRAYEVRFAYCKLCLGSPTAIAEYAYKCAAANTESEFDAIRHLYKEAS
jgi:hypothetical protein